MIDIYSLDGYDIREAVEVLVAVGSYKAKILSTSATKVLVYTKEKFESYIVAIPPKLKKLEQANLIDEVIVSD